MPIVTAAPDLAFTKTMTPLVSGPVSVGDEIEIAIGVQDDGSDDALAVAVMDALPTGLDYVPDSLEVDGLAGTATPTDAAGDDVAEYDVATRTVTCVSVSARRRPAAAP